MIELLRNHFITLKSEPRPVQIHFDTTAKISEINPNVMKWHDFIGPFGMGFHVPIIQFNDVKVLSKKELKGGHLKLTLSADDDLTLSDKQGRGVEALLFSPTAAQKIKIETGQRYHFLTELQWNYFNGQKSIQLLVKDLKSI